jgi:cytochrome P450
MLWPLVIGVATGALVFQYCFGSKTTKSFARVPGYPLVGNALELAPENILASFDRYREKYGNFVELRLFMRKLLHFSDAKYVREILQKRPKLLIRGKVIETMAYTTGYLPNGLFHANDAVTWGKMRKLSSPAFSKQNLVNMSLALLRETEAFVQRLSELSGDGTKEINMLRESSGYTVHVISSVAFGNESVPYIFEEQFYEDVRTTFDVLLQSALFPFPQWVWRLSPYYKMELAAGEANMRFTAACQEVLSKKRAQIAAMPEEDKKNLHGLIDLMIKQQDADDAKDDEILANVKTFYLAGSDTTSMAISWSLYLLAQNPGVVAAVRAEVAPLLATLSSSSSSAQAVSDALAAMPLTTAVMRESVRLYPAGPVVFLDFAYGQEAEELVLSNGMRIASDNMLVVNLWHCLKDPEYFPDPEAFLPARWLTSDKESLARMEVANMGFGAGARACPGMGLALAEGTLAVAMILHQFDIALACPAQEITAEFKFTLQPSKLPMFLTKRAN